MLWKQYIRFRLKAQIYLIFNGLVTAKLRQSDITFVKKKKGGDGVVKVTFDRITGAKVAVEAWTDKKKDVDIGVLAPMLADDLMKKLITDDDTKKEPA